MNPTSALIVLTSIVAACDTVFSAGLILVVFVPFSSKAAFAGGRNRGRGGDGIRGGGGSFGVTGSIADRKSR